MAAPIQMAFNTGNGATLSGNLGGAPTAGNQIVVIASKNGTGAFSAAPTGWGVSSWATDQDQPSGRRVTVYRGTTDGSSGNGTVPSAFLVCGIAVYEIDAALTLDATNKANSTGNSVTGSITPTASADVLLLGHTQTTKNTTAGPSNSFTINGSLGTFTGAGYRDVSSASGSYNTGFTHTDAFGTYGGVIVAYAVPGGGGGGATSSYYSAYYYPRVVAETGA